jgi:hypothetical protein
MRGSALSIVLGMFAIPAWCHDPITTNITWTQEISRLVYAHCAACHGPQGGAMSLMTYQDARPWAKAIRNEVMARRMPPFDPVKGVGGFLNDPSLTQPEMDLFIGWVEGGSPEGSPADLPATPKVQPYLPEPYIWPPCNGSEMEVKEVAVLAKATTVCAIKPSGPLEVTALLPDDTVRRLIWIRDFHSQWNTYYLLSPKESLPKGTRILVYSPSGAGIQMLTGRLPAR